MPFETENAATACLEDLAKIQDGRLCPHRSPAGCSRVCAQRFPGRIFRGAADLWDVDPPGCAVLVGAYASLRAAAALEAFPEFLGAATVAAWEPVARDLADFVERMEAAKPKRKKKSPPAPLCQRGEAGAEAGEEAGS